MDTTAPEVTLNESSTVTVEKGRAYTENSKHINTQIERRDKHKNKNTKTAANKKANKQNNKQQNKNKTKAKTNL